MRIFGLLAMCMAGAIPLTATGKTSQAAATVAPAKNAEAKNTPAQRTLARTSAMQNPPEQISPKKDAPAQSAPGGRSAAEDALARNGVLRNRVLRQLQADRGIYLGANTGAGSTGCLKIQSYNFSQAEPGKMPELESVTTCTSLTGPLMRQVRRKPLAPNPEARAPEVQYQQGQKDPK